MARRSNPEDQLLVPEAELLVASLLELRRALLELGYSRAKVNGCIGFLMGERTGHGVVTSPVSRSEYRKMLRAVAGSAEPGLWAFVA